MTRPDGPPLSRAAFDRAGHRRVDDQWLAAAWPDSRVVVISSGSSVPVTPGPAGSPMPITRTAADVPPEAVRRFLGIVDGIPHFATVLPEEPGWLSLRELGPHIDDLPAALLASAIALEQWHLRHVHCPRCGALTVESKAGWTRTCTADGSEHFPRTDPAVIMLVHDDAGRALLGRGPQWGTGRFSTLAGFVEPGESLEAAVAREVFEEVGVAVTDVRYVASQPWPFPASLMLGFSARLDGDPGITLDPIEMAEAGWFTRAEIRSAADWTDEHFAAADEVRLRQIPPRFSISRFLIDRWVDDAW